MSSNTAAEQAGGIQHEGTGTLFIGNSTVFDNRADDFGGIKHLGGQGFITYSTIFGNQATRPVGSGGGLLHASAAGLLIENSIVAGNTAAGSTGAS